MPAYVHKLPELVVVKLAANKADEIQFAPELIEKVGGIRLANRTADRIYYGFNTIPTATVYHGYVLPSQSLPLDVVPPSVSLGLLAPAAGEVEAEITEERFSAFGAVGITALLELNQVIGDNTEAQAALAAAIEEASASASVAFDIGTGQQQVSLDGVGPNDEYLIYSIFHGYDRADTGQAGLVSIAMPTGPSPLDLYWGSPGGGSTAPGLSKAWVFPPMRVHVGGGSIVITARTPNAGAVIQSLVVLYRYVPGP